jgi:hypothetical protein
MRFAALIFASALLAAATPASAEPTTCSQAYEACAKPEFGRHCDRGCASTCKLRYNGCLKTGAFSTPGKLLQNLKRR